MVRQDDQFSGLGFRFHDEDISHGNVIREHLDGLDQNRLGALLFSGNGVGKFQNSTVGRADKEYIVGSAVNASNPRIDGNDGQAFSEPGLDEDRSRIGARDGPIHERVTLDEVEARFRKCVRIIVAKSRPWIRDLRLGGREPVGVHRFLVLERAVFEGCEHVGQLEAAHGTAGDGVLGRREDAVKDLLVRRRRATV